MTVTATFLHAYPQQKMATMIHDRLSRCREAKIVSGFATPDGVAALRAGPVASRITRLVLGAATFKAFEALDRLIAAGLPADAARVHLGHSRRARSKNRPFERLRPMLHSKIYLFDMPDGMASAFVGSHNLTGFALRGMNGEAGVLLEGNASDQVFVDIGAHVEESYRQAVRYDPTLKEAYARWYAEYLARLRTETQDIPRDTENRKTIVLLATAPFGRPPAAGERVYFEIDKRIAEIQALATEVHLHLLTTQPTSPRAALAGAASASHSLLARVEAIDSGAGSAEVEADWFIGDRRKPVLQRTVRPFRPKLRVGQQQVRALIKKTMDTSFDYIFEEDGTGWVPILGDQTLIDEESDDQWNLVTGFGRSDGAPLQQLIQFQQLPEMSPDSGSYILFPRKRRKVR